MFTTLPQVVTVPILQMRNRLTQHTRAVHPCLSRPCFSSRAETLFLTPHPSAWHMVDAQGLKVKVEAGEVSLLITGAPGPNTAPASKKWVQQVGEEGENFPGTREPSFSGCRALSFLHSSWLIISASYWCRRHEATTFQIPLGKGQSSLPGSV